MHTSSRTRETHTSRHEQLHSQFETASRIIDDFSHDEVFHDALQQQGLDSDNRGSYEYASVLSGYAEQYVQHFADEYDPRTLDEVSLLADAPLALYIDQDVSTYNTRREQGEYLSDEEWADYKVRKAYVAGYDQRLSDYLHRYGDVRFSDVVAALSDKGREYTYFSPEDTHDIMKRIARGARTEAVSCQLLDITDIPYRTGTTQEDLAAGDVIFFPDTLYVKGDEKSSLTAIAEILGKGNLQRGYELIEKRGQLYAVKESKNTQYDGIVFYPGFTDQELGNACRLPDGVAAKKAAVLQVQLKRAFKEMKLPLDK